MVSYSRYTKQLTVVCVVLVHLDLILSVQPIALLCETGGSDGCTPIFSMASGVWSYIDELGTLVLNAIEQPTLIWPPKGRRQL